MAKRNIIIAGLIAFGTLVATAAYPPTYKTKGSRPSQASGLYEALKTSGQRPSEFVRPQMRTHTASSGQNQFRAQASKAAPGAARRVMRAPAVGMPAIYGTLIYSSGWTENSLEIGVYSIPTSDAGDFVPVIDGVDAQFGGVLADGVYYATKGYYVGSYLMAKTFGYSWETHNEVFSFIGDYEYVEESRSRKCSGIYGQCGTCGRLHIFGGGLQ